MGQIQYLQSLDDHLPSLAIVGTGYPGVLGAMSNQLKPKF